ncbi:MAG: glycosyltransferase family 4 protein [Duncaniella sp.]|nr:glycosyltransferase family 4 protein [Duncaniella sp.]
MRILQIIPGKIWGGAEQYIVDLSQELVRRGHEVDFVAYDVPAVTEQLDKRGIRYTTLPMSWSLDRGGIKGLAEMLGEKDYDVVHVHATRFVPLAVKAAERSGSRARVVMTRHEAHRTAVPLWYRGIFRKLHRIIFVSDLVRRRYRGANSWITDGMTRVIHNSIPSYPLKEVESLREKYGIAQEIPLIMFAGRVKKSKGCTVIMKALARLADRPWDAVFIGAVKNEAYQRELEEIASKAGIRDRIHFYGFTPDARQFMRQADVALAPSVTLDSCPLSNIEYIQMGVCEISTNNGGQAEYLENERTALLVDPGDDMQLADALARVLDDEALRDRLAKAGREHFEQEMTYDRFVDKVLEAYSDES